MNIKFSNILHVFLESHKIVDFMTVFIKKNRFWFLIFLKVLKLYVSKPVILNIKDSAFVELVKRRLGDFYLQFALKLDFWLISKHLGLLDQNRRIVTSQKSI